MKSFYPNNLSKNWKIVWILIQLAIISIGYYLFVYRSYGYKSWNDLIGGTMVMLGIFSTIMTFVDSPYKSRWYEIKSLKFYLSSVLLGITSIFLMVTNRDNFYEKEATIPTLAKVIGKERVLGFNRRSRNRIRIYATIQYFDKGKEIIQRLYDYEESYVVGYYVPIKYSENQPDLFRIDYEFEE
ncbi:hypothetical protein [Flagellimonas amoyensis]|nr:hypothetical protein [Allomuricauda amoyensis]